MLGLFLFSFINFELIFSLKYWTLSLKIESAMQKEELISPKKNKQINILFWTLEFLLFSMLVLQGVGIYTKYYYIEIFVRIGVILICSACLFFIIDAFRRFIKCLEHDKLGISKL